MNRIFCVVLALVAIAAITIRPQAEANVLDTGQIALLPMIMTTAEAANNADITGNATSPVVAIDRTLTSNENEGGVSASETVIVVSVTTTKKTGASPLQYG